MLPSENKEHRSRYAPSQQLFDGQLDAYWCPHPLQICQIFHPAPQERLETVTEIKNSRLFVGVYVILD